MTRCRAILIALILLSISSGAISGLQAAPFQGRVVDAETGEPLEGTVIVVVWYRPVFYPCMDSCSTYHDAAESVADAQGNFSIDISMGLLANSREILFYKPGYHTPYFFTYPWVYDGSAPRPADGETIRLIKIKRRNEPQLYTPRIEYCTGTYNYDTQKCVPQRKVRNYVRLFELEQKIKGY